MIYKLHQWDSLGETLVLNHNCKEQVQKVLTGLQKAYQMILVL